MEHWYPRNPEEASWEEVSENSANNLIDRYGNLCLVRQDTNVRLSNSLPSDKKTNMKDTIARESLKLHRMRDANTTDEDGLRAAIRIMRRRCWIFFTMR